MLLVLTVGYVCAVVIAVTVTHFLGDRHPIAGILLYGPRWPLLAAAVPVLLGQLALRRWGQLGITTASAAVVLVFHLDLNLPRLGGEHGTLRVMSYNIAERDLTDPWLATLLNQEAPDILALVECRPPDPFVPPLGYHFGQSYGLCLLSRFPIGAIDARDQEDAFERGGKAAITLFTLAPPEAPSFQVMVVHLASPRDGIEALLHDRFDGLARAADNLALRDWEAGLARRWLARSDRPALVLGDFNLAEESTIFQRHFGDLTDAFSSCGFGFGNTKHTRWFGARIDHVLMTDAFDCSAARVVDLGGSDHRPVAATLRLR